MTKQFQRGSTEIPSPKTYLRVSGAEKRFEPFDLNFSETAIRRQSIRRGGARPPFARVRAGERDRELLDRNPNPPEAFLGVFSDRKKSC